jgi:F-type H+-transporting ATPase subunit gamma
MPKALNLTFSGVGKDVPTFAEASAVADEIMKLDANFDEVSHLKQGVDIADD